MSLHQTDASELFHDLQPIIGPRESRREAEIRRLALLFPDGSTDISLNYTNTSIDEVVESGFTEGNKVKKTHVVIERNSGLRNQFFSTRPSPTCDFCTLRTAESYPWTERVLDIHHLLPLCSGIRVEAKKVTGKRGGSEKGSTTFEDLVAVCPTCHRAIHRYYDAWLGHENRADFENRDESRKVYSEAKSNFPGLKHA